jgi:cytochrome c biogenesis protein CcmG/thiol:disulfide interchange protein DsbE
MSVGQARAPYTSLARKLARIAVVVLAGLLIALLAYGLGTTSPDDTIDSRLAENRSAPAPGFSLELLERGQPTGALRRALEGAAADGKLGVEELRGFPVVLNFWASWCDPCAEEASVLEQGWQTWGPDPGKEVSRDYGATGIPETYFISARGEVVAHVVGVVGRKQLESGIAAARAGRPLGTRRGGARRPPR